MATKKFALHTEPHVADIGGTELLFAAEVYGDDFMDAYAELQARLTADGVDLDDPDSLASASGKAATRAVRLFLAELMLPESAELFTRLHVVVNGEVQEKSFLDLAEAEKFAAKKKGEAKVRDAFRLPDRILVELLEWATALYGGGNRPTGSSGGSVSQSPPGGTPGRAPSRSRGSTSTRSR